MTEPAKFDVLDRLHDVFTRHGIASRTMNEGLVTDVVQWAADACRQSQAAESAALVSAVQQLKDVIAQFDRVIRDGRKPASSSGAVANWASRYDDARVEVIFQARAVVARLAGGPPPK